MASRQDADDLRDRVPPPVTLYSPLAESGERGVSHHAPSHVSSLSHDDLQSTAGGGASSPFRGFDHPYDYYEDADLSNPRTNPFSDPIRDPVPEANLDPAGPGLSNSRGTSTAHLTPFQIDETAAVPSPATSRLDSGARLLGFHPPQQQQQQQQYTYLGVPSPGGGGGGDSGAHAPNVHRAAFSTWRDRPWLFWLPAWQMYLFFLLGFLLAVGHHIFYSTIEGRVALGSQQVEMLRYGTVLAFTAKACLVAAVVQSYQQRIWVSMRTKLMTVAAVDALFAATEDLSSLLNWEIFKSAKIAVALALFSWLAPLVVILTSNTLTVQLKPFVEETECAGVRTLNFTFEETTDWRHPREIERLYEIPVSTWNTTRRSGQGEEDDDDWFDYYTSPSMTFEQVATLGAFMEDVVGRKNASAEVCGSGWNCTFTIEFTGPGYKCEELADGLGSKPKKLRDATAPFGTDVLLPEGDNAYYAFTSGGDYSSVQLEDLDVGGIPKKKPPYPKNFGAFRTEPLLWIGYAVLARPDEPVPMDRNDSDWAGAFIPKMFGCELYETAYAVKFNYTEGQQYTRVESRDFVRPVIDTTYQPGKAANDGTMDNTTAVPEANYVLPRDVSRYRRVAAYHSIGSMVREFVNGTVQASSFVNPIVNTRAIQTKLLDPKTNFFAFPHLMALVQAFAEDILLSLLSNPSFAAVVWAARPDEQSGARVVTLQEPGHRKRAKGGDEGTGGTGGRPRGDGYGYPCTRSRMENVFAYHRRDLWIAYAVALLLALVGLVVGTYALLENDGVRRNARFSSVAAAASGPALERFTWGREDRGDVAPEVKTWRVGYGLVSTRYADDEMRRSSWASAVPEKYGFGLEGDVRQLKRPVSIRNSVMGRA